MTDEHSDDLAGDLQITGGPDGGLSHDQFKRLSRRLGEIDDRISQVMYLVGVPGSPSDNDLILAKMNDILGVLKGSDAQAQGDLEALQRGYYPSLVKDCHRIKERVETLRATVRNPGAALSASAEAVPPAETPGSTATESAAESPKLKRPPRASKSKRADTPSDAPPEETREEASRRVRQVIKDL